jgi:hypothetical protein
VWTQVAPWEAQTFPTKTTIANPVPNGKPADLWVQPPIHQC